MGKLFLIGGFQLINEKRMVERENHHWANVTVVIFPGKNHE